MALELLKYANRAKVATALTESGYPVTRMTVNRWAAGGEMPGIAQRMVLALFGHTRATKEPPPEWARAIQSKLDAIYDRQDTIMARQAVVADTATQRVIEALTDPERLEWAERIAGAIRDESQKPVAEGSDDPPASGAQGGAGPAGPGLGSFPFRDSSD
jgi:hypothetical protein